jgi:myo-inositol-1(or 4)-monophosphatase
MILQSAASDLALIEAAAREAGALARSYFGREIETWSKGAAGPVTEADLAVNALLLEKLIGARPHYGWLSEETADDPARLARARVWVVDPIDGTQSFIQGKPEFVISIGLVESGAAIAGAVYNPITDELWSGAAGAGARRNGAPIAPTPRAALEGAFMVGRKRFFDDRRWPAPWPPLRVEARPAIALRLALVADGGFDAIVLPPFKNEWDVAGGAAILAAAGARVTDLWDDALAFNQPAPLLPGVVAAGPALHALLIERTAQLPDPRAQARAPEDAAP